MRLSAAVATLALVAGCAAPPPTRGAPLRAIALRLAPGDDLKASLERVVKERDLDAAVVLACAGSLERASIRFADKPEAETIRERVEIVSLSGTLSARGGSHLHLAVSTGDGRTLGGHLKEGSIVYTTAEVTLGVLEGVRFRREPDPRTGFKELAIDEPR